MPTSFGFSLWVPIDINKNFWNKLEESLASGGWVLLDAVVAEIKHDNDGLKKWCDTQKKKGLVKILAMTIKIEVLKSTTPIK